MKAAAAIRASLAMLMLAFVVAACAMPRLAGRDYNTDAARDIFAKTYESVFEKYIEAVDFEDFTLHGIEGLESFDETLTVERPGGMVRIALADATVAEFAAPGHEDIDGWARVVSRAIEQARARSPVLARASAEDVYDAVINAALAPLDRHSRYTGLRSARDHRAQREGFGGIGIGLEFRDGVPAVKSVYPDSPAERAGIKVGDVLTDADGARLAGLGHDAVIWKLRGEVGSMLDLGIARKGAAAPLRVVLRRARIVPETVRLTRRGEVAHIAVTGFNQRTARNLDRVLDEIDATTGKPVRGIVLDLRDNPGGLLDQAVAVANRFLGRGRIVSTRGRHPDSYQVFNATGHDRINRLPLAVVINGRSASAAEIVAAALQDHGRAVVVGSNSYGKGSVQNITRLPNDGELILTWARFHAPSGYALENLGVMPNYCTSPSVRSVPLARQLIDSAATLASWRTHSGYEAESVKTLRRRCPQMREKTDDDIAAAELVLADGALYARALAASEPAVARSVDQGR